MRGYRRFVTAFFSTALVLTALYLGLFRYQFGAPIEAEWWLYGTRFIKSELAAGTPGPKIIVSSGSNSLFGIDSELMERELHRPVVNISTHAALALDQMLGTTEALATRGDTVVMPLEWAYYMTDYRPFSDWMVTQTIAWNRDYFSRLTLRRKLDFIGSVSPARLWANVVAKVRRKTVYAEHPARRMESKQVMLHNFHTQPHTDGYGYRNMNRHGDMLGTCKKQKSPMVEDYRYDVNLGAEPAAATLTLLRESVERMHARGVKVVISFPPMAINPNTSTPAFREKVLAIAKKLRASGRPVIDEPTDYFFAQEDFFDSPYHLNCWAKSERTERLVQSMRRSPAMWQASP